MAAEKKIQIQLPRLRAIITSAEKLHDYQREFIEGFFGVKVFDQYGNAEMSCLIHQCSLRRFHVRADYRLLEILDDQGEAVSVGQPGSMVCTGFINYQMPLIRYRIGDRAVWASDGCPCGLQTPIIQEVLGREDDVLIGADGRMVGRMSPVLKGLPILESQYVQHVEGAVTVRIVPADDFVAEKHEPMIVNLVKARLGVDTKVDVCLVDALDYGAGHKLRNVISTVCWRPAM